MKELGLYIHIPFCEKKCYYCDFTSFSDKKHEISKYIEYLIKELSLYKKRINGEFTINSIFIGGGTPSSIDEIHIEILLNFILKNFNTVNASEITIEINPGTLTLEKAKKYKELGINRVSMGLQSLNDRLLKSIGRIHNANDFFNSYRILVEAGFKNINIDLMFGLPGQSLEDLLNSIEDVIKLKVNHISLYSLILEEGTQFYKWNEEGKINMPSEELDREMYHKAVSLLKSKGYNHYEISNFSKENYRCIQNMTYWKVNSYLGVGINSHSNLNNTRFANVDNFKSYYNALDKDEYPLDFVEVIDREMEIAEYIILGLRLIEGIDKIEFKNRFNIGIYDLYKYQIDKNIKDGLLVEDENNIRLSGYGLDLANRVELDFFP